MRNPPTDDDPTPPPPLGPVAALDWDPREARVAAGGPGGHLTLWEDGRVLAHGTVSLNPVEDPHNPVGNPHNPLEDSIIPSGIPVIPWGTPIIPWVTP